MAEPRPEHSHATDRPATATLPPRPTHTTTGWRQDRRPVVSKRPLHSLAAAKMSPHIHIGPEPVLAAQPGPRPQRAAAVRPERIQPHIRNRISILLPPSPVKSVERVEQQSRCNINIPSQRFHHHTCQTPKMTKYEKKRSARRSTQRHPITMASTAEPPDPMPCALATILLQASRAHGCRMQRGLFPGACWVRAGTCVFGPFLRAGCAGAAWMRGGSLGTSMGSVRLFLATWAGGVR